MSMLLFAAAGLFLLAVPLVLLLAWAAVRESRHRNELRARALAGGLEAREASR